MSEKTSPRSAGARDPALSVLLVEPSDALRERLARLLSEIDGVHVREADWVPAALIALRDARIDVVVLDVDPGGGGGVDAILRFRTEAPHALIVALGSDDAPEMAARCFALGANYYFVTAREFMRLRDVVAAMAGGRRT
jgi:DNA-binding NarL/FixJ family response regulator